MRSLELFLDRRLAFVFGLGFISGYPWVAIGSTMGAWLQEEGLSRSAIGAFGAVFTLYALNFLWAPVLDQVRLPLLSRLIGPRRSWILLCQMVVCVGISLLSASGGPAAGVWQLSILLLLIAAASATLDIAVDAYRIEILGTEEARKIPLVAAAATCGWWTGFSLPGALAFFMADLPGVGWPGSYTMLAVVWGLSMLIPLAIPSPRATDSRESSAAGLGSVPARSLWQDVGTWLHEAFVAPLGEFLRRNGLYVVILIFGFIFFFKVGEAFLGRMAIVFYKEVGYSNTDIALYSKLNGWWVTILFTLASSVLNYRFGLWRGLFISGIAMAVTNLLFAWIAIVGPLRWALVVTVAADNFAAAFSTVAFVSFISALVNRHYTATQYALMASLGNFGRTSLASFSGLAVDSLGGAWALFFVLTAIAAIPGLTLLWLMRHRLSTSVFASPP